MIPPCVGPAVGGTTNTIMTHETVFPWSAPRALFVTAAQSAVLISRREAQVGG
jgi:hypothetical protein